MTEAHETTRLTFDLAIIGAGPGGYAAALRAAELGLTVALVERDATLGGTCLNRGCIPSKALITASHTIDTAHRASELGVNTTVEGIDYVKLRDWRLHVVDTMTKGLAGLVAHRGIVVFRAEAALAAGAAGQSAPREVRLSPAPGQTQVLRYDKAEEPREQGEALTIAARDVVLAMGARPRPLPGIPFRGALIDSTQALELDEFPSSAVVIGAGAVAIEFASMWNAAGVDVTLLIRKDRVLSGWDRRTGVTLTRELKRLGVAVVTNTAVTGVDTGMNLGATVRYTRRGEDGEREVYGEIVLAAIGRDPVTDAAWLADAGVEVGGRGHIATDALGRTSSPHVWAVGDVTAGHALAHRAFEQGVTVAEAIAGLDPKPVDEETVPQIVFSSPEAASVGLTAAEAKGREYLADVTETSFPMMGNARMLMTGAGGSLSVVSGRYVGPDAPADGRPVVLGVHIVAPVASDLIAEAEQLVGNRVPLSEAARLIHPHPTFSETLGEALLKADRRPLHTR
ncbi:FAD-dependent oxidoreductase [Bifidobacterium pullorum subsp. saeculare]|uniref:FAD-dependent oxidoreductase n=1 Tax=Bifidobacterium pullorum subsp. saeculare TaxID=78257 RepID=A0A938WYT1_9BIFI|nr:FAD-dependent oxidoreductase [Bifidobacterium pullorum]MBM6699132.1 FAD-dependent oxidoreductase [Bifidobacterium pullorum subsp. saeculare]